VDQLARFEDAEGFVKILLAEDDSNVSIITQLCLERIGGHTVTVAPDGAQALDAAKREAYDLVILDGMMPKLSGLEVAKELVAMKYAAPIIFLSAKSEEKDIQQFLSIGAGYIAKPFDPPTICARIDAILASKGKVG
jgi:two-component system phosphate regulon response regulator PhoB